jgi:hypothetical protein
MRIHALVILAGMCAVVGTFIAASDIDRHPIKQPGSTTTLQTAPVPPGPPKYGHLIVQLEGNVHGLTVTWITPKTSGYNETRIKSSFEVDLFDGAGAKLGTYPIDLSAFDTDPARIGKPLRVQGCEIRDSRIVTIVNVPYFKATASMRIRSGGIVIGRLGAARIGMLTEQGEVR